jgi:hypothetical protein
VLKKELAGYDAGTIFQELDMPFLKFDEGAFDDLPEEFGDSGGPPTGAFKYEGASAQFVARALKPESQSVLEALKSMGAHELEVTYDGGHDEGFAYPEWVYVGDKALAVEEIAASPAFKPLVSDMRKKVEQQTTNWYRGQSDAVLARSLLDQLADELAALLLGEGYGTGEYELYGSFRAHLKSGEIIDNPNAKPRSGGLGD